MNPKTNKSAVTDADYGPGGRVQAQLRIAAANELTRDMASYPGLTQGRIGATRKVGTSAETYALTALAAATGVELRIWAFDAKTAEWALYVIDGPAGGAKRKTTTTAARAGQVIWLRLQVQHYQWLQPRAELPPDQYRAWLEKAVWQPLALRGEGASSEVEDAGVLAALGLAPASPSIAPCAHASPNPAGPSGHAPPAPATGRSRRGRQPASSLASDHGVLAALGLAPRAPSESPRPHRSPSESLAPDSAVLAALGLGGRAASGTPAPGPTASASQAPDPEVLAAIGLGSRASGLAPVRRLRSKTTLAAPSVGPDDAALGLGRVLRYTCPCGWQPCRTDSGKARRRAAVVHWRLCRGTPPPPVNPECREAPAQHPRRAMACGPPSRPGGRRLPPMRGRHFRCTPLRCGRTLHCICVHHLWLHPHAHSIRIVALLPPH